MSIGIIGAANVAHVFARHLLKAKIAVTLSNSRGPDSLASPVAELGAGAIASSEVSSFQWNDGSERSSPPKTMYCALRRAAKLLT
ncbi:NAD(P)-binding domain-containing protein [Rhizobium sp. BR 315]|uniref:NAD(P)-binding domain-containing protein n=1 Tax=Rhizobium sp. BR 315 TaxID=3040014 RepID=UPI003D351F82